MNTGSRIQNSGIRTLTLLAALGGLVSCSSSRPQAKAFATPEDAVRGLLEAVKAPGSEQLTAVFGPDAQDLVDTADPGAGQRARRVFRIAARERWHLEDQGADKVLVIGNEDWPFPIPLTKSTDGWRFDVAKGREEVLNRRIGRNELAAIRAVRTYVVAQRIYAKEGHDGKPAGIYARTFRSDTGRQNGLFWIAAHRQKQSPVGDLIADAAADSSKPAGDQKLKPFHGYYFRILTSQGAAAAGGAKDYVVNSDMSGGFALVAWPAQYGVTGVTTFIVNQDGAPREKDLGDGTDAAARAMTQYNPDESWAVVEEPQATAVAK